MMAPMNVTKPTQEGYKPSHPGLFFVKFNPGAFTSSLVADQAFEPGQIIAHLNAIKGPKAYTTVQCGPGPDDHVEIVSDLVYVNHSCDPNIVFDLSSLNITEWHVRACRAIKLGDTLTYFYPSTEWDMDQPFDCFCGSPLCLRQIQGAMFLSKEELLNRGFINPWILSSVEKRDGEDSTGQYPSSGSAT